MNLKSIDIYGFKSFAEPIHLHFDQPVTIIVGPNGSGKSNIADAVWWVLGEQSAKSLRGGTMQDVIFVGTESRPPLNYARVTIVFDNSDRQIPIEYEEISVTRKLFRSGESEYYINKSQVRLKDIREMFMDTGVGKEGYSLIGQGRIDELLSGSHEERRGIFEEASGVTKYKYKLENAVRKLEKIQDDLIRIEDIFKQVTEQHVFLKKEAEKARQGIKIASELEHMNLSYFYSQWKTLQLQKKEKEEEYFDLKHRLKALAEDLERCRIEKEPLNQQFHDISQDIEHFQAKTEQSQERKVELEKKNILYDEQFNFSKKEILRLESELEVLKNKIASEMSRLKDVQLNFEKKQENVSIIQEKVRNKQNEISLYQEKINEIDGEMKAKMLQLEQHKHQLNLWVIEESTKKGLVAGRQEDEKKYSEEQNTLVATRDQIRDEMTQWQDQERDMSGIYREKAKKLNVLIGDKEELSQNMDQLFREINEAEASLREKRSNHSILNNMYKNYEGYYMPVQQLMRAVKKDDKLAGSIYGVLGDLIHTERKYQKAVDVALGSAVQNIVVYNESQAKDIIEYLKRNRIGRLTFLPMDKIKGKTLLSSEGLLASEAVEAPKELRSIVDYLLGRTIFVENMDQAIFLRNKEDKRFRFVTLDGEVFNPTGSIVGGYLKSGKSSLINRKYSIEKLEKEIQQISNEIARKKEKYSAKEKLHKITMENIEIESLELEQMKSELSEIRQGITTNQVKLDMVEERLIQITQQRSYNHSDNMEQLANNIKVLQETVDLDKKEIKKCEDERDAIKNKVDLETKAYYELSGRMDVVNRDVQLLENTIIEVQDSLTSSQEQKQHMEITLQNSIHDRDKKRQDIQAIQEELETIGVSILQSEESLKLKIKNKDELQLLLENKEETYQELKAEEQGLYHKIDLLNLQKEGLVERENQLEEELEDNYGRQFGSLDSYFNTRPLLKITRKQLQEKKEALKAIGYFSVSSIDEYEEVKEKKEFLDTQQNDLKESKDDILKIIEDLEIQIIHDFTSGVKAINENFQKVFMVLFGGGKAGLVVDNIKSLKPNIEIQAQPPGKKLQNINLLSGGEKTLTAIALLFSIFTIRPTPFCILDEIDASLDEANIQRYVDYLQTYHKNIQFIIITHRKRTMEMADMLYGVTMEEEGVSKVLSLNLAEAKNGKFSEPSGGGHNEKRFQ